MERRPPKRTPRLVKADYEVLAAFRYGLRKFLRASEEMARARGVTPKHYQALLAVKGFPGRESITIGELAEQLQIRHHSAVGLVGRLVGQDLLARTDSPDDKRLVFVSLTTRGAELLEDLAISHREELRRLRPAFQGLVDGLRTAAERPERGGNGGKRSTSGYGTTSVSGL